MPKIEKSIPKSDESFGLRDTHNDITDIIKHEKVRD